MKDAHILAMRYAKALFSIAKKEVKIDQVLTDLKNIVENLTALKDKSGLFLSSIVPYKIKKKLWDKLLSDLKISPLSENFIQLLLKKNRVEFFILIKNCFIDLLRQERGVVLAEVFSTTELTDDIKTQISNKLSQLLNKKIELESKIKPKILGGLVIKTGSMMIDTSLESKLNSLKHMINSAKITSMRT